jgi:hypothetical protein
VGDLEAHIRFLSTKLTRMHLATLQLRQARRPDPPAPSHKGGAWHLEPLLNPRAITFTQLLSDYETNPADHICWVTPLEQRWWYLGEAQSRFMNINPNTLMWAECDLPSTLAQRTHIWRMIGTASRIRRLLREANWYGDLALSFTERYSGIRWHQQMHIRMACYDLTCIAFGLPADRQRAALGFLLPEGYPHLSEWAFDLLITKPISVLNPIIADA